MVEYYIQQKCGIKCLRNGDYMKKLFEQIVKFGIVGAIAFVIDYAVLFVLVQFLHMDSMRQRFPLRYPLFLTILPA